MHAGAAESGVPDNLACMCTASALLPTVAGEDTPSTAHGMGCTLMLFTVLSG